ncbi:MAG TPA: DUF5606 domain-containing protein [Chitinophagaceae bacterium]|nr:DUF5606 domain-containing protein [Chitinophagaceae bacterium]
MEMEYRQIVSVTGLPGLYQLKSTKKDGAFVVSLDDHSTKYISARKHQITPLESIEIYTINDNVALHKVFHNISMNEPENFGLVTSKKEANEARRYFKEVLPEFDEDRVYTSDIQKIYKWYQLLKKNNLLNFEMYDAASEEETDEKIKEEE